VFALGCRLAEDPSYARSASRRKRAWLYASHRAADDELRREPLLAELIGAEPKAAIFACDARGIGESQPNTTGGVVLAPYGSDYFYAPPSLMLDYPSAGQRTPNVRRVIDWLKANGHVDVHLAAEGRGPLPATFAPVLADSVTRVTLRHALTSYRAIADPKSYVCPLAAMLPGVLKTFDIPDGYRTLAGKPLRKIEPSDQVGGAA
jgi:hypothetical protein